MKNDLKISTVCLKKSCKKNSIHGLTALVNSMSISSQRSNDPLHIKTDINEIKQKIKECDLFYFMGFLQTYEVVDVDLQTFYILGKYGSKPLYTIIRNSNIFEAQFEDDLYIDTLFEGIGASDNHLLLQHLVEANESCTLTSSKLYQYAMCFIEKKAFKTMQSTMLSLLSLFDNMQESQQAYTYGILKKLLSRVIDSFDCKMIEIVHNGIKNIACHVTNISMNL